jgi:hypothetical protein
LCGKSRAPSGFDCFCCLEIAGGEAQEGEGGGRHVGKGEEGEEGGDRKGEAAEDVQSAAGTGQEQFQQVEAGAELQLRQFEQLQRQFE